MSITVSINNGVRVVHLRGPVGDPLTEQLARFISYSLSEEVRPTKRKKLSGQ